MNEKNNCKCYYDNARIYPADNELSFYKWEYPTMVEVNGDYHKSCQDRLIILDDGNVVTHNIDLYHLISEATDHLPHFISSGVNRSVVGYLEVNKCAVKFKFDNNDRSVSYGYTKDALLKVLKYMEPMDNEDASCCDSLFKLFNDLIKEMVSIKKIVPAEGYKK